MIISQTPYRISFAGGGTDLPSFYRHEFGAVLNLTIQQHLYVTVHNRFSKGLRVSYSRTETVDRVDELQHELVRESIKHVGLDAPLEITTIGDIPAGTGLGSSSTLTVGVLNALYARNGTEATRERLAAEACHLEIDIVGKPIGRQDQYAAAFGGFNYFRFDPSGSVTAEPLDVSSATLRELEQRMLLVYTGRQRSASTVLEQQSNGTKQRMHVLGQMRDLADRMRHRLLDDDLDGFGGLLHESWLLKRSLGFGIADADIDRWYESARKAGAHGGKLLGAGAGGFMLLVAPHTSHDAIRDALDHPQEIDVRMDPHGSRIIFCNEQA